MRLTGARRASPGSRQRGLTLLELVVTLLILTILTGVAVRATTSMQDRTRREQTRERMTMIRTAILGDAVDPAARPATLSGFAVDMGRLPENLRELLQTGHCSDPSLPGPASCAAAGGTWTWSAAPSHGTGPGNLSVGWRGPYLASTGDASSNDALTDGWGRASADGNYGWAVATTGGVFSFESYGLDHADGPNDDCAADLAEDCSASITPADYEVSIAAGLQVSLTKGYGGSCALPAAQIQTFDNPGQCQYAGGTWGACSDDQHVTEAGCVSGGGTWTPGVCGSGAVACTTQGGTWNTGTCGFDETRFSHASCAGFGGTWTFDTLDVCMGLYHRRDGAIVTTPSSGPRTVTLNGRTSAVQFDFPGVPELRIGEMAYAVRSHDGDCDAANPTYPAGRQPQRFALLPRTTPVLLTW